MGEFQETFVVMWRVMCLKGREQNKPSLFLGSFQACLQSTRFKLLTFCYMVSFTYRWKADRCIELHIENCGAPVVYTNDSLKINLGLEQNSCSIGLQRVESDYCVVLLPVKDKYHLYLFSKNHHRIHDTRIKTFQHYCPLRYHTDRTWQEEQFPTGVKTHNSNFPPRQ